MSQKINRLVLGSFTLALFFSQIAFADFSDLPITDNRYVAIHYLKNIDVLKGYDDGTFGVDKPINRAEALKVILLGAETELLSGEGKDFGDVPRDAWFAPYVYHAANAGIVSGDGETGLFAPARQVNKAEFLKMILLSFEINPADYKLETSAEDVPDDAWFAPYVKFALSFGIMQNEANKANPGQLISRGDAAKLLFNTLERGRGLKPQILLNSAETHLIETVQAIENIDTPNAALQVGKAEELVSYVERLVPEHEAVLTAKQTVTAMKYLIGAYSSGQYGNAEAVITASKKAWEAADAIPKTNGQQTNMEVQIKKLAEVMAARARGDIPPVE